jgi:hypothetical protein
VLTKTHDSLYYLNGLRLPYPVYRFATGDVDGDGKADALVGGVKGSRYYPTPSRRLFIYKQVEGKARPLWLGSKLGGELCDFRYQDGCILSLEAMARGDSEDSLFAVCRWRWKDFGPSFERFVCPPTDKKTAKHYFER